LTLRFALLAALVLGCGSASAPTDRPASAACAADRAATRTVTVDVGDRARSALVHAPEAAEGGSAPPLVLAFHGFASSPDDMAAGTGLSTKADEAGFVVVYPAGAGTPAAWELVGETDTDFVAALLAALESQICFDPSRVYATGFSMGGGMAGMVACRLADRIAAVAPVSGVHLTDATARCRPTRPVPVVTFHGVLDEVLPYEGGPAPGRYPKVIGAEAWAVTWAGRNGCDADAKAVERVSGTVDRLSWTGCEAPVELYRITNRGHSWPGSPFDASPETVDDLPATTVLWEFLARHALPGR